MYLYSNPADEQDTYKLPDVEVFQLTAEEAALLDEDMIRHYMKRPEFRLATMNSRARERMLAAMIDEQGIEGGWFFHFCFPGCLPESNPFGPYASHAEAVQAARDMIDE